LNLLGSNGQSSGQRLPDGLALQGGNHFASIVTACCRPRLSGLKRGSRMGNASDLEMVIRELHRSDIRVGFQTFSGGMAIWIGDQVHRVRAERIFDKASPLTAEDSAAQWLHTTALRLFPDSNYARRGSTSTSRAHDINHRA